MRRRGERKREKRGRGRGEGRACMSNRTTLIGDTEEGAEGELEDERQLRNDTY